MLLGKCTWGDKEDKDAPTILVMGLSDANLKRLGAGEHIFIDDKHPAYSTIQPFRALMIVAGGTEEQLQENLTKAITDAMKVAASPGES